MADFYTSVLAVGNNILYRGVKNGRSVCLKVAYTPTLYLQSNKQSKFKSLNGETLEPLKFESMKEARDFIKNYDQVENFKVYGNSRFEYAFIAENFKGDIEWDQDKVKVAVSVFGRITLIELNINQIDKKA